MIFRHFFDHYFLTYNLVLKCFIGYGQPIPLYLLCLIGFSFLSCKLSPDKINLKWEFAALLI